jgi:hypothetical protein
MVNLIHSGVVILFQQSSFYFNRFLRGDFELQGLWVRKLNSGTLECVKRILMPLFRFFINWLHLLKNLMTGFTEIGKVMFVAKINFLLLKQWSQNTSYSNMCKRNEQENRKVSFKYLVIYAEQIK